MNIVLNLVFAVQILTALAMIGLVLIQHGKGADMGASFGSGASGSLFGATGSANFLSRSTAVCAAIFFAATLWLAYSANDRPRAATNGILEPPRCGERRAAAGASGAAAIPAAAFSASAAAPVPAAPRASAAVLSVPATTASGAGAIPKQ